MYCHLSYDSLSYTGHLSAISSVPAAILCSFNILESWKSAGYTSQGPLPVGFWPGLPLGGTDRVLGFRKWGKGNHFVISSFWQSLRQRWWQLMQWQCCQISIPGWGGTSAADPEWTATESLSAWRQVQALSPNPGVLAVASLWVPPFLLVILQLPPSLFSPFYYFYNQLD